MTAGNDHKHGHDDHEHGPEHDHKHDDHGAHDHGAKGHAPAEHKHDDHGHDDHGHEHHDHGAHDHAHHDHGHAHGHDHHHGPFPEELRLNRAEKKIEVDFDDGESFEFTAEFLRVHSPSAEVMGHGPGQQVTVGGKRKVGLREIEPVGNYAIRIVFDDGHDTGIFSWAYLHELGVNQDRLWQAYEEALKAKRLSRDL